MAVRAVHIKDVVLDGHNRQGMSVCGGMINLTVEDSVFSNTAGHAPACEHHNDLFAGLDHRCSLELVLLSLAASSPLSIAAL